MRTNQSKVREFHQKFGVPALSEPTVPSDERVRLRLGLKAEEFLEALDACDDGSQEFSELWLSAQRALALLVRRVRCEHVNLPAFIDALADLEYVIHGTALEFGVDMEPVFDAVHLANMKKEGGGQDAKGKLMKPPGWVPPDIAGEIEKQRSKANA